MHTGGSSKEHLGQSTWTFLHTLAAQYPEQPTRSQKKDTTQLVCSVSVSCVTKVFMAMFANSSNIVC